MIWLVPSSEAQKEARNMGCIGEVPGGMARVTITSACGAPLRTVDFDLKNLYTGWSSRDWFMGRPDPARHFQSVCGDKPSFTLSTGDSGVLHSKSARELHEITMKILAEIHRP